MCGIAGLILSSGAPPPEPATLSKLIDSLHHRGPDGTGHAVVGRVALVHNRLSIIDLVTGDQPLFAGPASLVCNGEIYNYRELRVAMPAVSFATNSDCEPPLHLWLREGADYAQHLRGMYAIAIHERMQRTVTLTRDPFGIKPLYIAQVAGGLAFASEPQALLEAGLVARAVRPAAREELLQLQFTTGTDTIFEGIQRLLPGETLTCADGHVLDRRRVSHIPEGGPENIDEDAALERLDRALEESVDLHQRSDVPYGMFLSGGIDSSTLLALMARLNSQPVLAFTAGFDAPGAADEREHAATVAKALGAKHETIEIDERMVWQHLPEIVACMDDPAADYAIIPTWFLARRARQDVKVVLSGEGGDEIFAGYPRYQQRHEAVVARRTHDVGARQLRPGGCAALAAIGLARRHRRGGGRGGGGRPFPPCRGAGDRHDRLAAARSAAEAGSLHDGACGGGAHAVPRSRRGEGGVPPAGRDEAARRAGQVDPAEVAGEAPAGGAAVRAEAGLHRAGGRMDQGAGVTARAAGGGAAGGGRDRRSGQGRGCCSAHIRRWRHGFACWKLLFYALWHRRHILGLPPAGDVFETLAAL